MCSREWLVSKLKWEYIQSLGIWGLQLLEKSKNIGNKDWKHCLLGGICRGINTRRWIITNYTLHGLSILILSRTECHMLWQDPLTLGSRVNKRSDLGNINPFLNVITNWVLRLFPVSAVNGTSPVLQPCSSLPALISKGTSTPPLEWLELGASFPAGSMTHQTSDAPSWYASQPFNKDYCFKYPSEAHFHEVRWSFPSHLALQKVYFLGGD